MEKLSTFELLPNELLIDIFEYLPIQDLYKTFFQLNSRLRIIINSFQGFRFEQSETEIIDDSAFVHLITILIIRHSNSINLTRYPNLRALKLDWPSKQQCKQTIDQSQLEHLHIGHAFHEGDTEQLLKYVFANGFPQLHSCHIENCRQDRTSTILSTLISMKILTVHSEDIAHLLSVCPNLNRLSIKFFREATIDFKLFQQWLPISHENLHTLILDSVDQMSIETIDSILAFVPNVTYLSIKNPRCRKNQINIEQIARSLHRHLPNLRQFYTTIWREDLAWKNCYTNDIEALRSLHPLFKYMQFSSGGGRLTISSSYYRSKLL